MYNDKFCVFINFSEKIVNKLILIILGAILVKKTKGEFL